MSDYCAYPKCGKELTHVQGRKKKKYCNQNCNNRHWHSLHPSYKPKTKRVSLEDEKKFVQVPIEEYEKYKNVISQLGNSALTLDIEQLRKMPIDLHGEKVYATVYDKKETKPQSSFVQDEVGAMPPIPNPNQSLISQYEKELSTLGEGSFARARKKWLNNKINQLKSGTI